MIENANEGDQEGGAGTKLESTVHRLAFLLFHILHKIRIIRKC